MKRNLGDGYFRIHEKLLRMFYSFLIQIFVERASCKIFKQSGEMVLAESGEAGYIVQAQVFGAMLLYVFADINELGGIFLLFAVGDVGFDPLSGVFSADQYEHFKQLGVDGGACQNGIAEIFPVDIQHKLTESAMDVRRALCGDKKGGRNIGKRRFDIRYIVQHGKVSLKNQPLSFYGGQTVNDAGIDQEKVALLQNKGFVFTGDLVSVL